MKTKCNLQPEIYGVLYISRSVSLMNFICRPAEPQAEHVHKFLKEGRRSSEAVDRIPPVLSISAVCCRAGGRREGPISSQPRFTDVCTNVQMWNTWRPVEHFNSFWSVTLRWRNTLKRHPVERCDLTARLCFRFKCWFLLASVLWLLLRLKRVQGEISVYGSGLEVLFACFYAYIAKIWSHNPKMYLWVNYSSSIFFCVCPVTERRRLHKLTWNFQNFHCVAVQK